MFRLLEKAKKQFPNLKAVSTGAIASVYQKNRVESICKRLGLESVALMWG